MTRKVDPILGSMKAIAPLLLVLFMTPFLMGPRNCGEPGFKEYCECKGGEGNPSCQGLPSIKDRQGQRSYPDGRASDPRLRVARNELSLEGRDLDFLFGVLGNGLRRVSTALKRGNLATSTAEWHSALTHCEKAKKILDTSNLSAHATVQTWTNNLSRWQCLPDLL